MEQQGFTVTIPELPARNLSVQLHDEEGDVKERNGDISTTDIERGGGPIIRPRRQDTFRSKVQKCKK